MLKKLLLFLIVSASAVGWFNRPHQLSVGPVIIDIEIVDTAAKRIQGLSNRTSLADQSGMLFIFPQPGRHSFWMKDMNFPLDFIWIRSGRVVQISTNVPATQPAVTLTPDSLVDQVLEIPAGFIDKNGIKVGDEVRRR